MKSASRWFHYTDSLRRISTYLDVKNTNIVSENVSTELRWSYKMPTHTRAESFTKLPYCQQSRWTRGLGGPRLCTMQSHWLAHREEAKRRTWMSLTPYSWRCIQSRQFRGHVWASGLKVTYNVHTSCLHTYLRLPSLGFVWRWCGTLDGKGLQREPKY
jgi:hypothetical protein